MELAENIFYTIILFSGLATAYIIATTLLKPAVEDAKAKRKGRK